MVPHPRYQQKPLSLGSVALVMTASRSTISPDANRESRSHGLTHLSHGRRRSQRRGGEIPVTGSSSSMWQRYRQPQRRDREQIPVTSLYAFGFANVPPTPQRRDQEQIPVTLSRSSMRVMRTASTKGPGTNPGHSWMPSTSPRCRPRLNEGTRNKSRSLASEYTENYNLDLPQRRDREQIPVTVGERAAELLRAVASTKGPGTNPGHCRRARCRAAACGCLNEGTRNKSRSLVQDAHIATRILASTKGPGTNPGHRVIFRMEAEQLFASTKGPGTNPGHVWPIVTYVPSVFVPQRRDQEQIPVTRLVLREDAQDAVASTKGPGTNPGHRHIDATRHMQIAASTKGPGTNPGHPNSGRRSRPRRCRLNEGTRNKSRSHRVLARRHGLPRRASTKGPGTNPGHQ